jgi:hypothetical protein
MKWQAQIIATPDLCSSTRHKRFCATATPFTSESLALHVLRKIAQLLLFALKSPGALSFIMF